MDSDSKQYQKSLTREIHTIGIPSFLETLFTTFASVIDSKMVSVMGTSAISAVSVTNQPRLFVYSIFFAVNTVTTSLVARYSGGDAQEKGNQVFDHVIKLVLTASIIFGVLSAGLARPIMILFSGQAVTLIGRSYGEGDYKKISDYRKKIMVFGMIDAVVLAVIFSFGGKFFFQFFSRDEAFVSIGGISCLFIGATAIFQTMKFINSGCLQGVGKMKEAAFCSIIAYSCVNLLLVALLVLVLHWGIWGVWTATFASQTSQALLLSYFIRKSGLFTGTPPE